MVGVGTTKRKAAEAWNRLASVSKPHSRAAGMQFPGILQLIHRRTA